MEDTERLLEILEGADMVFLTTGLGGGTGTGATPIIANLAAELDILVIAIVHPALRVRRAGPGQAGRRGAQGAQDRPWTRSSPSPTSGSSRRSTSDTSVQDAFRLADDILRQAVQGISDLITKPGLINLDFADVKSVMKGMGMAFMGTGLATGENRALEAAEQGHLARRSSSTPRSRAPTASSSTSPAARR